MSKFVVGRREKAGVVDSPLVVEVIDEDAKSRYALEPRFDLWRHSPDGPMCFECGYGGAAPAQLALALCAEFLDDTQEDLALMIHHNLKTQVVASLPRRSFKITEQEMVKYLAKAMS